jgi:hypothetical protein
VEDAVFDLCEAEVVTWLDPFGRRQPSSQPPEAVVAFDACHGAAKRCVTWGADTVCHTGAGDAAAWVVVAPTAGSPGFDEADSRGSSSTNLVFFRWAVVGLLLNEKPTTLANATDPVPITMVTETSAAAVRFAFIRSLWWQWRQARVKPVLSPGKAFGPGKTMMARRRGSSAGGRPVRPSDGHYLHFHPRHPGKEPLAPSVLNARPSACPPAVTAPAQVALSCAVLALPPRVHLGHPGVRRGRPSGGAVVECLVCGTPILPDPRRIQQGPHFATVPCTACSALVPMTHTDALRAVQEQMRVEIAGARTRSSIAGLWHRWR